MHSLYRQFRHFSRNVAGATAVEFAIMGSVMITLVIGLLDVAFALYVRNSFNHAVGEAARQVYLDSDRSPAAIETDVESRLARFNSPITTTVTTDISGALEYRTLNVKMTYHYKSPLLSSYPLVLETETRAPLLDYKL